MNLVIAYMKKLAISISLSVLLFFSIIMPVFAGDSACKTEDGTVKLCNPLKTIETPQALIGQIINSLFGIIGSLALVMFVYGGFLWMTSSGSAEQVKKGKDIFIWAVVGLVVVFSAYSLVRFVIQGVGG